jgi:hypothetical protein
MDDNAAPVPTSVPVNERGSLGEPVDFDVRGLGRRLPRTEAPEGWIKRIERRRQGRVWVGYFHVWTTDADGQRVRRKEEGENPRARVDAQTRGPVEAGGLY